jgi:hypothetical protein
MSAMGTLLALVLVVVGLVVGLVVGCEAQGTQDNPLHVQCEEAP